MNIKQIILDDTSEALDVKISRILKECGVSPHLKGYSYLRECIYSVVLDRNALDCMCKRLLPYIASTKNTTFIAMERCMRHAIHYAWNNAKIVKSDILDKTFKYGKRSGVPTIQEFIANITDEICQYFVV